ncbi:MAG: hypothetical protein JWO31_971, partial [Phycisphaerales bacterium]|nr:hypothetical protein [Phycisphaerales bacterium]
MSEHPTTSTPVEPANRHDDEGYVDPRAWNDAKAAFGPGSDVADMLGRLETCQWASPRLLLATAIHAFLARDEVARLRDLATFLDSPDENGRVSGTELPSAEGPPLGPGTSLDPAAG